VRLQDRGEPVAVVLLGVVFGADPEEAAIEQPQRARQHLPPAELLTAQVLADHLSQTRKSACEVEHLVELLLVAPRAPARVVEVLLASRGVDAGGLQMTIRVRADPDIGPGGRDRELADPREHFLVADPVTVRVQVLESSAAPPSADAGLGTVDPFESCHEAPSFPFFRSRYHVNERRATGVRTPSRKRIGTEGATSDE
jgi:hypothetical protein